MTDPRIVNVVGTITYQQELDLASLAQAFEKRKEIIDVIYEPTDNHWLQTHFAPDNSYVAFYRSGRCSIAGCDSSEHFYIVADQVNSVMCDLLKCEYDPEIEISNIVATADFGEPISLEVLAIKLGMEQTEYEPEQFPALIYRGQDYVMLVFASGKLLCTGLTDADSVAEAVESFISRIHSVV